MTEERIFVPPATAAKMLSISRAFLYTMVKRKEINLIKLGRRSVVRVADLYQLGRESGDG